VALTYSLTRLLGSNFLVSNHDAQKFSLSNGSPGGRYTIFLCAKYSSQHSLAKNYVTETGVVALVDSLDPTACEATALVAAVAAMRPALLTVGPLTILLDLIHPAYKLDDVINFAINVTSKDSAAGLAWRKLHSKAVQAKKEAKILSGVSSHCEKRDFVGSGYMLCILLT
jgi:hypothetical protein